MKIMICGHARHGKDTLAEMLGLTFKSSSEVALEEVIWPEIGHRYPDKQACFDDRTNNREVWHNLITAYNTPDLTRLARDIYSKNDMYVGIRNREEFYAAKAVGLFQLSIWVDASERLPPEPSSSNKMLKSDCDIVIDNNGTLESFYYKIARLKSILNIGGESLSMMQKDIISWANSVMPHRTITNACTKLVMEEIPEFLMSDNDPLELADIAIILLDMAHLAGVDLEAAIREKMAINKARTWQINQSTGLLKHVES